MDWLRLPLGVLRSYIQVMSRLRAEGSLERVGEALIGAGNMEKRTAERILGQWERAADAGGSERFPKLTEGERREHYVTTGMFEVEVVE